MEITCPECGSSIKNDLDEIPKEGRTFSCSKCKKDIFCKPSGKYINSFIINHTSTSNSSSKFVQFIQEKILGPAIIIGGLGIIVLFLYWQLMSYESVNSTSRLNPQELAEKRDRIDNIDARTFAKIYVKKALKAPSTAKFQNEADFGVAKKTDKNASTIRDVWEVSGYVDAQNSFGAMLRQQWYVKMKKVNDSWLLLDIKFWE